MLIAQITDTHIVRKGTHWLSFRETETEERLRRVVCALNTLVPRPDVVVLTGDATNDGTEAQYLHFKELLSDLQIPLYVIPGNHDCREPMRQAFNEHLPEKGFLQYVVDHFPLRLVFLDTLVEGKSHGEICQERFAALQSQIVNRDEKPTLLFMHHPPLSIGTKLFDEIACLVPSGFEEFISTQKSIVGLFCGHYHHLCVTSFGKKLAFLAPSVAPVHYFDHPEATEPQSIDLEDPAITLHKWFGEKIVSQVIRLKKHPTRIEWAKIKEGLTP
jgi:Icc protein